MEYIESNFNEPLSNIQLADLCSVSLSTLNRIFLEVYGISPGRYLIKTRIRYAEQLLKYSNTGIADIAMKCGYCDVAVFSHVFKKLTGVSPSKFNTEIDKPVY